MKTDAQIQQDVLHELEWDQRVKETEIGVQVHEGVVTLSGTVPNYAKNVAALEAAHRVAGVLDVANEVRVTPPDGAPTDTDIAGAIRNELCWNTFIDDRRVLSSVAGGWVTLQGTVDTVGHRTGVENAIRDLEGVRGITNLIAVKKQPIDTAVVRSAIEKALERRADREAKHISVVVDDNTVTLIGRVHSWTEKDAVVGAARQAVGIADVVDHLHIDPYF